MTDAQALEYVRGCAFANRYRFRTHALERMEERGVSWRDVDRALVEANSCTAQRFERWMVVGPDLEGEALAVIVEIEDGLLVITVYEGP